MPLYEYECEKCGAITELLISFKEADKKHVCEECGGKLRRVFSVTADSRAATGSASVGAPACGYGGG